MRQRWNTAATQNISLGPTSSGTGQMTSFSLTTCWMESHFAMLPVCSWRSQAGYEPDRSFMPVEGEGDELCFKAIPRTGQTADWDLIRRAATIEAVEPWPTELDGPGAGDEQVRARTPCKWQFRHTPTSCCFVVSSQGLKAGVDSTLSSTRAATSACCLNPRRTRRRKRADPS